jgi:hypothetical protein
MPKKFRQIPVVISVIMLLLAIAPIPAQSYYITLRLVVCITAIYLTYLAKRFNKKNWLWMMLAIAILFNPVLPVRLDNVNFVLANLVTACIFIASLVKIKDDKDPPHLNKNLINMTLVILFLVIIIYIAFYSLLLK